MIYNTYHISHIDTYNHVILYIPENVAKYFGFTKFATPGTGMLGGVLKNDTKVRYIM